MKGPRIPVATQPEDDLEYGKCLYFEGGKGEQRALKKGEGNLRPAVQREHVSDHGRG